MQLRNYIYDEKYILFKPLVGVRGYAKETKFVVKKVFSVIKYYSIKNSAEENVFDREFPELRFI